jgi:energy-coupling factor transporter ATP-binding protein EcfA2
MRARIRGFTGQGGDTVALAESGVTCIVGSNNVGKSQALRDLMTLLSLPEDAQTVAVASLDLAHPGSDAEEIAAWLPSIAAVRPATPGMPPNYAPVHGGNALSLTQVRAHLRRSQSSLGAAATFYAWHATAGSLLGFATGSLGLGPGLTVGSPLGRLFRDGALEAELSTLSKSVFGLPLLLDRISGDVRLRVGKIDVPVPPMDRPTVEYANAVGGLPSLETQGDGVKSFLGLALAVVAGQSQILLVDEPEAFLHPAQARALGRWLSAEAIRRDIQVVVSTHDRDLVLGLLDGGPSSVVTVLRITRSEQGNRLHELPSNDLAAVWADPVLRYSNVLQGLFHRRVVICEADADCRFFGAVLDDLADTSGSRAEADDVLFVPSGGKQRVGALATALARLGVVADAVLDFDVLRQKTDVKGIVEALGGAWVSEIDNDYVTVSRALNNGSLWDVAKQQGLAAVPQGEPYTAAERLLTALAAMGVRVVPIGEMEGFDRSIGLHGAGWVSTKLAANGHKTCQPARDFVLGIMKRVPATI